MKIIRAVSNIADKAFLYLILVFGLPASIVVLIYGSISIQNRRSLLENGVVTTATVTDVRVDTDEEAGYDIRYSFRVGDRATLYSLSDETKRRNLWYPPTDEEWEIILQTNEIEVIYLPENPWNNRPVDGAGIGDPIGGLILGILIGIIWVWTLINTIRSRGSGTD